MGDEQLNEAGWAEEPLSDGVSDVAAPTALRRGRRGLKRWAKRGTMGLVVLALAAFAYLSQTGAGQRLVLDGLLDRIRPSLAGELSIDAIRSGTLLTGLTLSGVRLEAEGGRRFLEADSIVVRYSPLYLVLGIPRVSSTTVFGLALEISRYPKDDFTNLDRLLAPGPSSGAASRSAPRTIQLGRVAVRGGVVEILTPTEEGPSELTVPAPEGGLLRRIAFEAVDMDLENTVLRPGGAAMLDARLASLTTSAFVVEEPLVIREVFGELAFGARGLEVRDAAFRLPGTLLEGGLRFGPARPGGPWTLGAELRADGWGDLADLAWIDSRIPAGRFRGATALHVEDGISATLTEVEAQLPASEVVATGDVHFGDVLSMRSLRVTASPLAASRLEPWVGRDLPFDGFLSGQATFTGTLADLSATGRLTLVPTGLGGGSSTVDFAGTVHSGSNPGATDLEVRVDPLNYRLLEPAWPAARALADGRGMLEVDGRVDQGLLVVADLTHVTDSVSTSRVVGRGLFRRTEDGGWVTDVRGALAPLSLPLLTRLWPNVELRGEVEGPARIDGRLRDLTVSGDLAAGDGRLLLNGGIDLASLGSFYRLDAEAENLEVSAFSDAVPTPSVMSGRITLEGAGFDLDALEGTATLAVGPSRVGGLRIDSVAVILRAADGVLTADTIDAEASGVQLAGSGSLGLTEDANGRASVAFFTESLLDLRPVFMGDSILVRDGLNPLEEDLLRVRGIEPDTLPTELDMRMAGSITGTAALEGRVGNLGVDAVFELAEAAYGHNFVDSARVELVAEGLPALVGAWEVDLGARGIVWEDREFEQVDFDGAMVRRRGAGALDIVRNASERYALTGSFALDSVGGEVQLEEALVNFAERSWALTAPTSVVWDDSSLSLDSLEITHLGEDPMWLRASGTLARGGDSDFRLDMEGFHVEQLMRVVQREDIGIAGHADLSLTVLGPSEQPVINALFQVEDPRFRALELSRLSGSVEYEGRSADLRIDAWDGDQNVLTAVGTVPIDLALAEGVERSVPEPMDLRVSADALEAGIALAYLGALEDVVGTISADVRIRGTVSDPEPSGSVYLENGAWTLEALGVRHTGVAGEALLRPDGQIGVKLSTTRTGTSTIAGVVRMDPLSNPTLDLDVTFDRFLAVARRDMQSTISGEFSLVGTYRLPVAEGTLTVDEGTLFVEEFARSSGVVDLRDPLLYADGLAVDTTVFVSQPLIAGLRNPFLDNLRVDIDMAVPRNMWLRSNEMNVEMGGELLLRYDRGQGDLVLIGELQALRGSYVVLGRTFEVDGGTVAFIGQPGINPDLDIQATSRVRRREGERLEIDAAVQGTLVQPIVTLSTEEAGLVQSDLVSYLLFGRASGELGRGGPTGGLGLSAGVGTLATGALANQLAGALGQGLGLDYLAISQGQADLDADFARSFVRTAQLEVGSYLGEDVFVVLILSSPSDQASGDEGRVNPVRGVRVEVAVTEAVFVEGFLEDRFLRSGFAGLGATGLDGAQIIGAFVFTEWGYGSQQE